MTTAGYDRTATLPTFWRRTSGPRSTTSVYDERQLRVNEVPVAAAVYVNDMYVEFAYSMETASVIRGINVWATNEYEHNGLRADGERVLGRLIDMARGNA
jgi:hypothetical protein